ncbi:hypothetical protein Tco_0596825 [Tanacetum coccineum]
METTKAQQIAWMMQSTTNRLKIGKCNQRLSSTLKSNEATIQVVLDALKLTPFYKAFEVTANVPEIYMQEFWATVSLYHKSLRFKMNDKSHTVNLENFRDMLQICRRLPCKKRQSASVPKAKGLETLSEVALSEHEQMKIATKRSKTQFHSSHASGSGDGADTQSKVPDEQQQKDGGTDEGAGDGPDVPDVPEYKSESEEESWTFSQGDDDDDDDDNDEHDLNDEKDDADDDDKNDSEETKSDDDGDDFVHPNFSTYKADDQEEEKTDDDDDDDEVSSDQKEGEQEYEEEELYGHLNLNLQRRDVEMIDAQTNQDTKDVHATLTAEPLVSHNLVNVLVSVAAVTPSSVTIIPQPPVLIIQTLQQTPDSTTTPPNPIKTLPEFPNFASLFGFEQRVSELETEMSEFKQTSQFIEVVSSIPDIVDNYLASKMKDAVDVAIKLQLNKLKEEAQAKNEEFLSQIDSNIKAIIKDQVKAQVSKILPKVEKYVTESLGAEVLVRSTNQP